MTHWMEDDWPDVNDNGVGRFCLLCHSQIEPGWKYAWCQSCSDKGECQHGNPVIVCSICMAQSDSAYDCARENPRSVTRSDEPPDST
jgi:hypothetical protein